MDYVKFVFTFVLLLHTRDLTVASPDTSNCEERDEEYDIVCRSTMLEEERMSCCDDGVNKCCPCEKNIWNCWWLPVLYIGGAFVVVVLAVICFCCCRVVYYQIKDHGLYSLVPSRSRNNMI